MRAEIFYMCFTWYSRAPGQRAVPCQGRVDRRADGLTEVYAMKARDVNRQDCGTPKPPKAKRGTPQPVRQIGPVETKLLTFGRVNGWVFGPWGEASLEIHGLVQRLAKARLAILDQQPGPRGPAKTSEAKLASLVSWIRRQLSFLAVQQQQRLLLERLQLLGDGSREAAKRRGCFHRGSCCEGEAGHGCMPAAGKGHPQKWLWTH